MKASVVDLRYRMKEVLSALKRREKVEILYHGKVAGTIFPAETSRKGLRAHDHPMFGMRVMRRGSKTVAEVMDELRGGRYRDL